MILYNFDKPSDMGFIAHLIGPRLQRNSDFAGY